MPSKIKLRSVSVEDLGNIVKHMIDGVLEDNDQVTKLRQAVFEEYYLKKMEELKQVKAKIDADYNLDSAARSQINTSEPKLLLKHYNFGTGDTELKNIKTLSIPPSCDVTNENRDDDNNAERSESHDLSAEKLIIASTSKSSKSEMVPHLEKTDGKTKSSSLNDVGNSSTVRVIRRQKYIKLAQEVDNPVANINRSNIALGSAIRNTTIDLTRAINYLPKSREQINVESKNNASNNVEIIEWWNSALRRGSVVDISRSGKPREIPVQLKGKGEIAFVKWKKDQKTTEPKEIPVQLKSKGEIAFEKWKKEKTTAYSHIFRQEQKRKRLEQTMKAGQIEKKQAANEAYLHWRRQQDARQKLRNTRKRILAQMESQKIQSSEKNKANLQAFKVWKRQKDIELRERKMFMMAYSGQKYSQQQVKPRPTPGINVTFNMWLDQLDCVLHQKYLRERRYLVRSFYCQPAYFGTTALSAR